MYKLEIKEKMSREEALALCDALPEVSIEAMLGRWRGSGVRTDHPLDGLLETLGWYGKEFIDRDHVHPLLFADDHGKLFALDPGRMPLSLLKLPLPRVKLARRALLAARFALQTHKSKARVRMVEYRGKVSAAMIYDSVPIYDAFRSIDNDTVLGIMDFKGLEQPFFFKLSRDK